MVSELQRRAELFIAECEVESGHLLEVDSQMPHKPTTDVRDRVGKHWCQRLHIRFVSCDDEALLVTVAQALGIGLRRSTSKNGELYWCNNRNTTITITVTQQP